MAIKSLAVEGICLFLNKTPFLNRYLKRLSSVYLDIYNGYSFEFSLNGEEAILKKLASSDLFKSPVIFDVGANVGNWSLAANSHFPSCSIHAFEMSHTTFTTLQKNLGNVSSIILHNYALSNKCGEIEYYERGNNHERNSIISKETPVKITPGNKAVTQAITGSQYCKENALSRIDFLKIDTEGAEYLVLQGFETLLKDKAIHIIQFEYGYYDAFAKTMLHDFYSLLEQYGYIIGPLRPNGVHFKNFSLHDNNFKSGPNYIACLPQYRNELEKF